MDAHIGAGVKPGLERIRGLLESMASPHQGYPIVHVAGTNGKTTVTRLAAAILTAHDLATGTFTSPHLTHVEQRFAVDGIPITPEQFAAAVADVQPFVDLYEQRTGDRITYFELTAALAFAWFAERAVEAAVIEVGLGGRLDATNIVSSQVAVITGISLDHVEYLGSTEAEIAAEKAAILKAAGILVTGPLPEAAEPAVASRVVDTGSVWRRWGEDYRLDGAAQAVGGWVCDVEGIYERYDEVFLPLHGRHQTRNLAVAIVACEELVGRALDPEAVRAGAAAATSPGRLEVVRRQPLVVVDGAHNPQGLEALAEALTEEFLPTQWTVVFGVRGPRDPVAMLSPLHGKVSRLFATAADDETSLPPSALAEAAAEALPGTPVEQADTVPEAVARALTAAGETGAVLVTGSLYVVGEAISALGGGSPG